MCSLWIFTVFNFHLESVSQNKKGYSTLVVFCALHISSNNNLIRVKNQKGGKNISKAKISGKVNPTGICFTRFFFSILWDKSSSTEQLNLMKKRQFFRFSCNKLWIEIRNSGKWIDNIKDSRKLDNDYYIRKK